MAKQYRQETFHGVQMTVGELRDLIGEQMTELAALKLRSIRLLSDGDIVAIDRSEVVELGGTVGVAIWRHTKDSPAHAVACLCDEPVTLKCMEVRMLLAASTLQDADVLSEHLGDLDGDKPVTISKAFHDQLKASSVMRAKKQKPSK